MKRRISWSLMILMCLFLLVGCSTTQQTNSTSAGEDTNTTSLVEVVPPAADKAVITGTLVQKGSDGNPDFPYEGLRVYLGILLVADDGKSTLARVDPMKAPQAITDAEGRFVFQDIEPTEYILVLQVPPNNLMKLNDPVTGKDMLIEAKAGEITDIGPQDHYLPWFIETPGPS